MKLLCMGVFLKQFNMQMLCLHVLISLVAQICLKWSLDMQGKLFHVNFLQWRMMHVASTLLTMLVWEDSVECISQLLFIMTVFPWCLYHNTVMGNVSSSRCFGTATSVILNHWQYWLSFMGLVVQKHLGGHIVCNPGMRHNILNQYEKFISKHQLSLK